MNPLITVVIPFVDHKPYIHSAYSAITQQSFKDWELLFVDNGSQDGSLAIAHEIQEVDARVRVIHQEVKGIAPARNKGLKEAKGDYISFLDVDDQFHPDKLKKLSQILNEYPEVVMAYGKTERIYIGTDKVVIQDWGLAKEGVNEPPELALDWTSNFYRLPQTGATLVRTSIARKIGGFPDNLTLGNDDVAWHIEIALRYPVYFLPEVVVYYYRHPKSEGARLNKSVMVEQRYLQAHLNYTHPRAILWEREKSNSSFLALSEKAITGNVISLIRKKTTIPPLPEKLHPYYRFIIFLFRSSPYMFALLIFKISRRWMALLNAERFPLR